jgi:ribosomal protein L40E
MEQRVYQGSIAPEELAQALLDEWDRDNTIAQAFGEAGQVIVQIGQREGGWLSDEPRQAITLQIEEVAEGLQVTMGQQQWIKDGGGTIMVGGLLGFFPFFFTFPLGGLFGDEGTIDQRLPGQIWQTVERYAGNRGAATGKTQRLATISCPECGVANPVGAERCSACGTALMPSAGCPQCGHTNPPGARFCNRCGTQLQAV